jgi:hypothetical protein
MTQLPASLAQILGRYEQTDNIAILFKYFFGFFSEPQIARRSPAVNA